MFNYTRTVPDFHDLFQVAPVVRYWRFLASWASTSGTNQEHLFNNPRSVIRDGLLGTLLCGSPAVLTTILKRWLAKEPQENHAKKRP